MPPHSDGDRRMTDAINRREFMQGGAAAAGAAASASLEAAGERGGPSFSNSLTTRLQLNGRAMSVSHEARVSLLDLLREHLQVTGTKKGCNEGACGACTVLLDGKRVN